MKWIIQFGGILLLALSPLYYDFSPTPGLLGFPVWLWWMIGIHLAFLFVLYRFTKARTTKMSDKE